MFEAQHGFGPTKRLQAQAVGRPGERYFRLLIESQEAQSALLWLEKEQLQALGLAAEQLVTQSKGPLRPSRSVELPPPETFPASPTLELKVGRLAIGQDESELESGPRYVLLAYDVESTSADEAEPSGPANFACRVTREQLQVLSQNIAEVVSAGRPRCPLCGTTVQRLDQPHGCVRANGYHR